jgi:hypothetical protein
MDSYINITWQTLQEVDLTGFNIYRSTSPDGTRGLLGNLPAIGPSGYEFDDLTVVKGVTYYYWIEFVSKVNTFFENPVFATIYWNLYLPILKRN